MRPEEEAIQAFLADLGVHALSPARLALYRQALTHGSFTYELKQSGLVNYERLEFLGDAVLKLLSSEYLYARFPDYREGDLTKIRAVVVSDVVLARLAEQLGLGQLMILGPNEERNGGRHKVSNLACAFEALLGALYLDGQEAVLRPWLLSLLADEVTQVDLSKTKDNYKAVLQEWTQQEGIGLPDYVTVREDGPPHDKVFHIEVHVDGEMMGVGEGKSKKEAQQMAARSALACLNQLDDDDLA